MKIIESSATIIEDELEKLSIYQRIAFCAGVCYQREPNKTEEEAQAFCQRMVEIGHHSTLEMSVVHLWVRFRDLPDSNYISIDPTGETDLDPFICSGSVRAFREAVCGDEVHRFLAARYPVLYQADGDPPDNYSVRFALPNEIPWQHQHVAVRFIVNRAVSHELVRHRPMSFLQESQRYCRYEDELIFIRPEWWEHVELMYAKSKELAWKRHMINSEIEYKTLLREKLSPQQARAVLPNSTKTELLAYASLPQWKHIFNLRCSPAADPEMRRVMIPLREQFKTKYPEAVNG